MIFSKTGKKSEILKRAQREGWALGAFNVSTLEGMRAVFQAAKNLRSPVIINTSEGESKYMGLLQAAVLVRAFEKEFSVPAILNLDHARTFDYIKEAIDAGYDAVHFDGSKLPLDENTKIAKKVVDFAHKKGILVEGEVGFVSGSSRVLETEPEIKEEDLTRPQEALVFVKETGVDNLAVNVGTFHGIFSGKNTEQINQERLKEIKNAIGDKAGLVLHGGSGISEQDLKEAVRNGIVKININTELRLALANSLSETFREGVKDVVPYKYLLNAVSAMQKIVEEKIIIFNSAQKI